MYKGMTQESIVCRCGGGGEKKLQKVPRRNAMQESHRNIQIALLEMKCHFLHSKFSFAVRIVQSV